MLTIGSLFTGGGGLDMAVKMLWPDARIAWTSEFDRAAAKLLAARYLLSPNHGDMRNIDWSDVEPVDILMGGYPCQPWSNAGKRKGFDDDRDGWPWFRDAISVLRPRLVLLENVAGHLVGGAPRTLGDLAALGYVGSAGTLRASDVGACHRRDRWFAVAHAADTDLAGLEGRNPGGVRERGGQRPAGASDPSAGLTLLPTPAVNDMGAGKSVEQWDAWTDDLKSRHGNGNGHGKSLAIEAQRLLPTPTASGDRKSRATLTREGHWGAPSLGQAVELASGVLPREYESWGEVQGNQVTDWLDYAPAIARWEAILGRPAPAPTDDQGRLAPAFAEWMMGWPEGWVDLDGLSRANRLKILGNGVVPQQAAAAFGQLLGRVARQEAAA